ASRSARHRGAVRPAQPLRGGFHRRPRPGIRQAGPGRRRRRPQRANDVDNSVLIGWHYGMGGLWDEVILVATALWWRNQGTVLPTSYPQSPTPRRCDRSARPTENQEKTTPSLESAVLLACVRVPSPEVRVAVGHVTGSGQSAPGRTKGM